MWPNIKKTVTTVKEALNALQESAYASNLDSSTEETTRKSKRRKPNFLIDSSEDEFELQSNKVSIKQKKSKHITDDNETVNDNASSEPAFSHNLSTVEGRPRNKCFLSQTTSTEPSFSEVNELNAKQYLANAETSTNLRKGERSKYTTVTKIDTTADDPFKRKLFTILEELKYGQKNILRVLESLTAANSATHLATRQFNLPITCDAELDQIENKLQNTENLEIMVKELILIGGDSVKMCTQLIMKKIMSKEMSLLYSLQGRKGKRQFNKLTMFQAITLAVQSKFSNAEECIISKFRCMRYLVNIGHSKPVDITDIENEEPKEINTVERRKRKDWPKKARKENGLFRKK
ncbi:hypothetical protein RN001_002326 [Aquatica leii]|uniref:DUF4806 domain-containing protein n=1 Tax=Aquatica leii TaxID=1421715 RepID=A0AAN7QB17_9COLE|nr:hypothetical protein RN001_002326 [Aquatica leii]